MVGPHACFWCEKVGTFGLEGTKTVAEACLRGVWWLVRALWDDASGVEETALSASKAQKPWQGRALEGSGGWSTRF